MITRPANSVMSALLAVCLLFAAAFSVFPTVNVNAVDYSLSPGLVIIKSKLEMKKCSVINCDVSFCTEDFEELFGGGDGIEFITVTGLPDPKSGVLRLSGRDIIEGQTISAANLDLVRFVPTLNTASQSKFTFTVDGGTPENSVTCVLNVLERINLSPESAPQSLTTMKNVELVKYFKAADPDSDRLCFEIVSEPKKGSVVIEDTSSGRFMYAPKDGYTGGDSFSYRVSDIYGNKSDITTVDVSVTPRKSSLVFADMVGHWAQNSVLKICDIGLMSGNSSGIVSTFNPEETMTRGDFLAMAMIMTGNEDKVSFDDVSVFADDSGIPSNIKCYAAAAYSMGVVAGYENEGKRYFNWENSITRAEAAVILDRLIEAPEPAVNSEFTDAAAIPGWASGSVQALVSCGIMNGNGSGSISPEKGLTRAEAAELLCNVAEYLEEKQSEVNEKKSFWSFLPFVK